MSHWVIIAMFYFLFMQHVCRRLAEVSIHGIHSQFQAKGAAIVSNSGHHVRGEMALEDLVMQFHGLAQNDTSPPLTTHSPMLAARPQPTSGGRKCNPTICSKSDSQKYKQHQ